MKGQKQNTSLCTRVQIQPKTHAHTIFHPETHTDTKIYTHKHTRTQTHTHSKPSDHCLCASHKPLPSLNPWVLFLVVVHTSLLLLCLHACFPFLACISELGSAFHSNLWRVSSGFNDVLLTDGCRPRWLVPERLPPVVLIALPGSRGDYRTLPVLYTVHSKKRVFQGVVVCFEGILSKKAIKMEMLCSVRERAWPPRSSLNQNMARQETMASVPTVQAAVQLLSLQWHRVSYCGSWFLAKLKQHQENARNTAVYYELVWSKAGLTDFICSQCNRMTW